MRGAMCENQHGIVLRAGSSKSELAKISELTNK